MHTEPHTVWHIRQALSLQNTFRSFYRKEFLWEAKPTVCFFSLWYLALNSVRRNNTSLSISVISKNNCNFNWTNIGYLSIKLAIEHAKWLNTNTWNPGYSSNTSKIETKNRILSEWNVNEIFFPIFALQFWCWKWTGSTITAGRWFAERGSCFTKSSTTPWIISLSIWFRLWNVAKINVTKFQHCKRKVSQNSWTRSPSFYLVSIYVFQK